MIKTLTINAGERLEFNEQGTFFRLMQANDPVTVEYFSREKRVVEAEEVNEGYAEQFDRIQFERVAISSATTQVIQFVIRDGNRVDYDQPPTGSVIVENVNGAFNHTQKTVTSANAVLLPANADRRYLLIQNKDGVGTVFINMGGAAATIANGLAIVSSASYECQGYVPRGEIHAIGDIANNPNVIVIEG